MGKKEKDAIYNEFLADLKAINPAIEEIVKDEKVSAKLRESVLARAEFSSGMDALRAERETFEGEVAQARTKIAGWQKWYGETSAQVADVQGKLQEYVDAYGELDTAGKKAVAKEAGMTKAEYEKVLAEELQRRDVANLKFADDLTDIKIDYRERFKEKLNTGEVFKIAGERGLPLDAAYNMFIADKVEEQRTAKYNDDIKRAKAEGAAEFASQHNLPVLSQTSDIVHTLDVTEAPSTARDRVAAAMRGLADLRSGR